MGILTNVDELKPKAVKSILVSQPAPNGNKKSPYASLAKKHELSIDFRSFIEVRGIPTKEFRKTKTNPLNYSAIIFTSRTAIKHFFRICAEMKIKMPQDTKYFCSSEAIALFLQKFIVYRKRKVFFGKLRGADLRALLLKHKKKEKFLLTGSAGRRSAICQFLYDNTFNFAEADIYETVASDLSDLEDIFYDMIVFFSPLGLKSLFHNFPDFKQNATRIAAFGPSTAKAVLDYGLRLDVKAPAPGTPSMALAISKYIKALPVEVEETV